MLWLEFDLLERLDLQEELPDVVEIVLEIKLLPVMSESPAHSVWNLAVKKVGRV